MLAVVKYGERREQHTFIIVLLIPARIAWYVLGSLLLLVLLALEHLLKELELRVNSYYKEQDAQRQLQ
jgi:hypothetical protein